MEVYFDYAASAPLHPQVREAYLRDLRDFGDKGANPSSLHYAGRRARELLSEARERVGACLGADEAEVIFTSGATEANALALSGQQIVVDATGENTAYLTSELEHSASLLHAQAARNRGREVLLARVSPAGVVEPESVAELLCAHRVASAAFMLVNNELGTIQPAAELAQLVHQANPAAHFHCDAAQGAAFCDINFQKDGYDSLAISGHKFGAPVGVGALVVKREAKLITDRPGGGQERGLRSGTQNVLGARALAKALEVSVASRAAESQRLDGLKARIIAALPQGVQVTTEAPTSPHILHLTTGLHSPEALLLLLDSQKIAASAGSACSAGVARPSGAMLAMGRAPEVAMGSLRLSFGHSTTEAEVEAFIHAFPAALETARKFEARN